MSGETPTSPEELRAVANPENSNQRFESVFHMLRKILSAPKGLYAAVDASQDEGMSPGQLARATAINPETVLKALRFLFNAPALRSDKPIQFGSLRTHLQSFQEKAAGLRAKAQTEKEKPQREERFDYSALDQTILNMLLEAKDGLVSGQLAEALKISRTTVIKYMNKLIDKGLVITKPVLHSNNKTGTKYCAVSKPAEDQEQKEGMPTELL